MMQKIIWIMNLTFNNKILSYSTLKILLTFVAFFYNIHNIFNEICALLSVNSWLV